MPADLAYGAQVIVSLSGADLPPAVAARQESVEVHNRISRPDMVVVSFRDETASVIADAGFVVGMEIEVRNTAVGGDVSAEPVFRGEVTALESRFDTAGGTHTVVRGYDKSHRLMKRWRTRAFEDVKVSDVVQTIAGEMGIDVAEMATDSPVHEYVAQYNETDWTFLHRIAEDFGYELTVELGELHLRRPNRASDGPAPGEVRQQEDAEPTQLVAGGNLSHLSARVTTADQVAQVSVRGWDPARKQALVAQVDAATRMADAGVTQTDAAGAFTAEGTLVCDRPVGTQAEVDSLAGALSESVASAYAELFGSATGNPKLKAGTAVSLTGASPAFNGRYVITAATHRFDDEGYRTDIEITGRHDRSLLGLSTRSMAGSGDETRIDGVVSALVSDNDDPEALGRVRLTFPWLDDEFVTWWCRIATLDAGGAERGALFIPEVNDEVLVAFEHGDMRRPYVVGSLWNGQDTPPQQGAVSGGEVVRREFRSRLGHRVIFHEEPSNSAIEIVTADGNRQLVFDETGRKIVLKDGSSEVTIDDSGNVEIDASLNVSITAAANVSIEAGAQLELKGSIINIQSSGPLAATGTPIQLN